jgi:predicted phage tail protein
MKVTILLPNLMVKSFQTPFNNIRQILSELKRTEGKEFVTKIIKENCKYILIDSSNKKEPIWLREETIFTIFIGYDSLLITHEVCGEVGADTVASAFFAGAASTAGEIAASSAIAAIANMALAYGLQMLMNALSPTPTFKDDPSIGQTRASNLFNGARITNEQGGIVPLIYGHAFAGGTLINSSVTTRQG